MRKNEIRYYLHNLDELKNEIEKNKEDIETYKNLEISTIHINIITDMPRGGGTATSAVETIAIKRADYISKLENKLAQNNIIIRCIEDVIGKLNGNVHQIIYMRYLDKQQGRKTNSWDYIANTLGYSVDVVKQYDYTVISNIAARFDNVIR